MVSWLDLKLLHSCASPKQKTPHISGELGCFFLAHSCLAALKLPQNLAGSTLSPTYLPTYLPIYLSIYLSIYPSIYTVDLKTS